MTTVLSIVSAPEPASTSFGRALPGGAFAVYDPALGKIVWRHLYVHAVTNDRADPEAAHLSRRVGDNSMLVVEPDTKASVWQDLIDLAFHRNKLFLRQARSLRAKNRPHAGVSRSGAMEA